MPTPFWLKLFGPNPPTTLREFRDALLTAPIGETFGDGSFLARLRALGVIPDNLPVRPDPHVVDGNPDPGTHGQASLAAAVVTAQELAAAPPPVADSATSPAENHLAPTPVSNGGGVETLILNAVLPGLMIGLVPDSVRGSLRPGSSIDGGGSALHPGDTGGHPESAKGPGAMALHGNLAAGFALDLPDSVGRVVLRGGRDFNLVADDDNVATGGTLTIDASPLRTGHHVAFDGSAETDGSFRFFGSAGDDLFLGGAGNDLISGMGGADILSGGGGSDTFLYRGAAESSGSGYDLLTDFDATADRIDLDVHVAGFDAAVQGGALSTGSFDADLGAALAGLGAGRAAFYAPDSGDLAGTIFLVVDANGVAGYQEGEDYVFALAGTTLADLTGHTGFFI